MPGSSANNDLVFRARQELKTFFFKNPNTVRKEYVLFWLNVWETWSKQKSIVNKIEENEPEKLNKLLETFYADEVKKEQKTKTVTNTSQTGVMIAALDRHLTFE